MRIKGISSSVLFVFALASVATAGTGTFLERDEPTDLRIADYNVNWDSIFPDDDPDNHPFRCCNLGEQFRRIIVALNPDIMCLQEINADRDSQDVAEIFDEVLPIGGAGWQAYIGYSNVIVSRWPLSMTAEDTSPAGQRKQAMALIELPDAAFPHDIYMINEHYKCCGDQDNDPQRQQQSDAVINWQRDARYPGGSINLPADTPIVVLGDLNIVGGSGPLNTLITGDISDEEAYGSDSPPDWDDSAAADLHPLHNVVGPVDYTWRNDNGGFPPGRLDYVIYPDSLLTVQKKFILNTTLLSPAELAAAGLQANDVVLSPPGEFDHLPLVVDLRFSQSTVLDGDVSLDGATDGDDIRWFAVLSVAGPGGDPSRIAHGDFNGNGVIDLGDLSAFVQALLIQ